MNVLEGLQIDSQMSHSLHGLVPEVLAAWLWAFNKERGFLKCINIPFPQWELTNLLFKENDMNKMFICFLARKLRGKSASV